MRDCEQYDVRLMLYQDNELDSDERRGIAAHLKSCAVCRATFNREKRFLNGVKRARPLYNTPLELRERLESLFEKTRQREEPQRPTPRHQGEPWLGSRLWSLSPLRAVAVIAVVVIVGVSLWGKARLVGPVQAATFAETAVDAHQRHLHGKLPLEMTTDVPAEISGWFTDKVPFTFKLPNYQEESGQSKRYRLTGARLVGFAGDYAGFVAYQMEEHPISLVVTSRSVAAPSGQHKISSKGIDFYYDTIDGLKVITWSHRDLTYALVSDLAERGQQSCMVCHQVAEDRDLIESLSTKNGD